MSHVFICPHCRHEHSIEELELWEVYDEDGKETELECSNCNANIVVTSRITGWRFEASPEDAA